MDASAAGGYGFADIIAPHDPAAFHDNVRGKVPLHVPGDPDKFTHAMSWDLLTDILNQSAIWTPYSMELALDTRSVPAAEYCAPGVLRDGSQGLLADMNKVREWLKKGASLVLNDIETLTEGAKAVADALGREPGGKVQCNLYCSWRERQAYPIHFDTHDVFALQIAGDKRWNIYQRHFKDPINHDYFKNLPREFHDQHHGALSQEVMMTPGDLLYIPRGYYHEALAQSDATIHLSFSVVSMIGLDLISAVFERAVYDEVFRRDLPHLSVRDGKAAEEHIVRLAGRFRELVRDEEFMAKFMTNFREFRYPRSSIKLPDDVEDGQ